MSTKTKNNLRKTKQRLRKKGTKINKRRNKRRNKRKFRVQMKNRKRDREEIQEMIDNANNVILPYPYQPSFDDFILSNEMNLSGKTLFGMLDIEKSKWKNSVIQFALENDDGRAQQELRRRLNYLENLHKKYKQQYKKWKNDIEQKEIQEKDELWLEDLFYQNTLSQ